MLPTLTRPQLLLVLSYGFCSPFGFTCLFFSSYSMYPMVFEPGWRRKARLNSCNSAPKYRNIYISFIYIYIELILF